LQSGDITIAREGDDYYLTSLKIDAAPDDVQANDIAAKIIGRINALGRMNDPNFRPVKLSRYTDDTGRSVVVGTMARRWRLLACGRPRLSPDQTARLFPIGRRHGLTISRFRIKTRSSLKRWKSWSAPNRSDGTISGSCLRSFAKP
jgi:hypothetical protein